MKPCFEGFRLPTSYNTHTCRILTTIYEHKYINIIHTKAQNTRSGFKVAGSQEDQSYTYAYKDN